MTVALVAARDRGILKSMTVEAFYLLRKDEPRTDLKDLDDVVLLKNATSDDGGTLAAGTDGTIVAVIREGFAYIVEFSEPPGTLATVFAGDIARADPASGDATRA